MFFLLQNQEKLKFVDVSYSQQLIKMQNFSSMPNLERLNIGGCTSLHKLHSYISAFSHMKFIRELRFNEIGIKEVPSSIRYLTSLEILDFSLCWKFQKLPDIFANMKRLRKLLLSGTKIKELPSSIGYLESLETIDVCDCSKFEKFPEIQGNMKCLKKLLLDKTVIKELPSRIGCLESLETISLRQCSKFEKFPEIQVNMKCLSYFCINDSAIKELPNNIGCWEALRGLDVIGTNIKELPYSIGHLTRLQMLGLDDCKYLKSLPSSICGLKSLIRFSVNGCSNLDLEGYWEIIEELEHLKSLSLGGMPVVTEVPSSIGHLKDLQYLNLRNCVNLVTLPNRIGNMSYLQSLCLKNCPKLQKLPNSLRSLQCCLLTLDLNGCNLMEGEIPSDLWCLSSLKSLDVSGNHIRRIPIAIIQLSKLKYLYMNHCPMLEEIPELPSSLRVIQAYDCLCLKALSTDPTADMLWSSLLNSFKLYIEVLLS